MLHEEELLELAEAYRYMARAVVYPDLRDELARRAQHYETVASLVKRRPEEPRNGIAAGAPTPGMPKVEF